MKTLSLALFLILPATLASAVERNQRMAPPGSDEHAAPLGTILQPEKEFGMLPGDVIKAINGQKIENMEGMAQLLSEPEKVDQITVSRKSKDVVLKRKKL